MTKLSRSTPAKKLISVILNEGWHHFTTRGREATFIRDKDPSTVIMVTLANEVSIGVLGKAIKTKSRVTGESKKEIIKEFGK